LGSASAGSLNVTGIVTASGFSGNVTGNINSSGISTVTDLRVGTAVTANSDGIQVGAGKSIRIFGSASGYSNLVASSAAGASEFLLPSTGGTIDRLNRAGNILQVVNTMTGAVATGTTIIPWDDTIPQNTEGTEFMTLAITPTSSSNKLLIQIKAFFTYSVSNIWLSGALFQDATAGALAATTFYQAQATASAPIAINYYMTAGTTSSTTFKLRAGSDQAGTVTFNGAATARRFGGVMASSITIMEIAA
jgi:hypothetical protein